MATTDLPRVSPLALILLCATAGYGLGVSGVLGFSRSEAGTPAARLGELLPSQQAKAANRSPSASDVALLRESLPDPARPALDLVLQVSGLSNGGQTDWKAAEAVCQKSQWERCDQKALAELKRRSQL